MTNKQTMHQLPPVRRWLKKFHPEAIPGIGAAWYDIASKTKAFQRYYEILAEDIAGYCANLDQGRILDVGTGPGRLLIELHKVCSRLQLIGMDLSEAMALRAQRNVQKAALTHAIGVCQASAVQLPFPDQSFEIVISTGSIHHWKDPISGLNEIYRILKPGGLALLYDIVSDPPASVKRQIVRDFGKLTAVLLWIHAFEEPFYTCRNFESLARSSAFEQGRIGFAGLMGRLALKKKE